MAAWPPRTRPPATSTPTARPRTPAARSSNTPPASAVPAELHYCTPRQYDAETGHARILLATIHPAHAPKLLSEATELLAPLVQDTSTYQRSAFLHGIHLARAHMLAKDREACADVLNTLTPLVAGVPSPRCRALLRTLRTSQARRLPPPTRAAIDRALSAT
ncbi:hypothetical protein [Streptomyces roseifaciens]|uniref:hypothetical protein n=1 Tax=Streptomyces roseifaciens TaxID=1488406 RepID=UPI000717FDB3|nr:hypothetical protein [Streptomyces roseifaciens]